MEYIDSRKRRIVEEEDPRVRKEEEVAASVSSLRRNTGNMKSAMSIASNDEIEVPLNDDLAVPQETLPFSQRLRILLVLGSQNAAAVLLTRYTRTRAIDERDMFDIFNFVLMTEAIKVSECDYDCVRCII